MYRRFLRNSDYLSICTEEALSQLTRGKESRFAQAEEAAEESIIEYLIDNYKIEEVLEVGKRLTEYSKAITYPPGSHFVHEDRILAAIRPINGYKKPALVVYWKLIEDRVVEDVMPYSQLLDYTPGDEVRYANQFYECISYNGPSYGDIRIPGIVAWEVAEYENWEPNVDYPQWKLVKYNDRFYTLATLEELDLTVNPEESNNWGLIGQYTPDYQYELTDHEYVIFEGVPFYPVMNVNADAIQDGFNIKEDDPRNPNVKKHLLRLAIYELHKLISPNNISSARITDYETSITWLRDASKMKINPKIPRKIDEEGKPVAEYAIATFARDYDPNKNPWHI